MAFTENDNARNLERMIAHIEGIDLSRVSEEAVINQLEAVHGLLKICQIPQENPLYDRVTDFAIKMSDYYIGQEALQQAHNNKNTRSYIGFSGKYKLFYNYVGNHAFLGRVFHEPNSKGKIKLDWRFNLEGRIEFVDSRLYPEGKTCHLMGDYQRKEKPPLWDRGLFWYNHRLPKRLSLIARGFLEKSFFEKYSMLLRFGHSTARHLVENLEGENVLDSYEIREGQNQLRELSRDTEALNILKKAAALSPIISKKYDNYLVVEYQAFL